MTQRRTTVQCTKHPTYRGVRPPRVRCTQCRKVYVFVHQREPRDDIAAALKIAPRNVYSLLASLGIKKGKTRKEPTLDDDLARLREKRNARTDRKRFDELADRYDHLAREHDAAIGIKGRFPTFPIVPFKGDTSESTAVVLASDWHIEETVLPEWVNGLNEFNLRIAQARVEHFFKLVLHLVNLERANTPIPRLVLWLGGDFITGNIHEENLETCSLTPIRAAIKAQGMLAAGIDFLLEQSNLELVVPCSPGNHSRITKKPRTSSEMGNSLELFVYHELAERYAGNPRVRFIIEEAYHTYLEVYDTTLRFHHGHGITYKGGVGGLTIPANKAIAQWNKGRWADLDCFGHYHTLFDGGNFVSNGSLIGHNPYAIREVKATFQRPKQAFFVINKRFKAETFVVRKLLL